MLRFDSFEGEEMRYGELGRGGIAQPTEEPDDERGVINKNQSEIDVKFTKMGLTRYSGGYHNTDVTCPEICRV